MNDASASSSPPPSTAAPQAPPTTTQFKRKTAAKDCLAGACAGCVSKTVVAPIERVKLLMQLQFSLDKKSSDGNNGRMSAPVATSSGGVSSSKAVSSDAVSVGTRLNAWEVAQRVYREQGVLAFWRGEKTVADHRLCFCMELSSFITDIVRIIKYIRKYSKCNDTSWNCSNELSTNGRLQKCNLSSAPMVSQSTIRSFSRKAKETKSSSFVVSIWRACGGHGVDSTLSFGLCAYPIGNGCG